ncbi:SsgA family sporulation/cell division regulator [Streptomyces sp. NPDC047928]|uniref:SsgA family sporulation/cell division regulator n=1 Tax=unclassified Streptomyces TaxID=2593676 RepID=UPI00370FDAAC
MIESIVHAVPARLLGTSPGVRRSVRVVLAYHEDDPLAVHLTFPSHAVCDGAPATWTFARELLATGRHGAAGQGDVEVRPSGGTWTLLVLRAPDGLAHVELGTRGVDAFLRHSHRLVPADRERELLRLDALIASLLGP